MPGSYSFSNTYGSSNFLSQTQFSIGAGSGIDAPMEFWAQGAAFHFGDDNVSIVPVALRAGETMALDLDFGVGGIDNIDTRITIINATGAAVSAFSSSISLDSGSVSAVDPRNTFTAAATGVYYIAVSHQTNAYVNNTFSFDGGGTDGGDFLLNLGFSALPALVLGGNGADNITLTLTQLRYNARAGDDTVQASTNGTTIDGGAGSDRLYGSNGADILFGGSENDTMYGYGDADVLVGGTGTDYIQGGLGNDQIFGGENYDYLYGEDGNDIIYGEADFDYLYGGNHHDKLYGGAGNDYLDGGQGNDLLDGGEGSDNGTYASATGNTTVSLLIAGGQVTGMGTDTLVSIENLTGGNFVDTFTGNGEANYFYGNGGNDDLTGNGGNDQLYGNAGLDVLRGGGDSDYLVGGEGTDRLFGGAGGDVFDYYNANESSHADSDRIYDFSSAQFDKISLQNINPGTLVFRDALPFTGTAAEARVITVGAYQYVYVDNDGNGTSDMRIIVQSATTLVASDFYL